MSENLLEVEPQGRYLEDWSAGDVFVTAGRTIQEADLRWFGRWVGTQPNGTMDPAHLMLAVMLLIQRLSIIEGTGVSNLGSQWTFQAPVKPKDTIRVRLSCMDARPSQSMDYCGVVSLKISVENQHSETVAEADWVTLILRRAAGSASSAEEGS